MTSAYKEPSPREASDVHANLIGEHRKDTDDADKAQASHDWFSRQVNYDVDTLNADSIEAAKLIVDKYYSDSDSETAAGRSLKLESLEKRGVEAVKESISARHDIDLADFDAKKDELQDALSKKEATESDLSDYAERYQDKLVVAALSEAALDGVQINHPDAIKIKK